MKEYVQVITVSSNEVEMYVNRGWEVFDTSKKCNIEGDVTTVFHIGYTLRKNYEELLNIVKLYEKYGFKKELDRKISELTNDNIDNYDTSKEGHSIDNEITNYLEKYELNVNGTLENYYKKLTQEELKFKYGGVIF